MEKITVKAFDDKDFEEIERDLRKYGYEKRSDCYWFTEYVKTKENGTIHAVWIERPSKH